MAQNPMMQDQTPEPPADDTGLGDTSQGYVVELTVKSDGSFTVAKESLQQEAAEENAVQGSGTDATGAQSGEPGAQGEQEQSYDTLGAALKAIVDVVKANPIGESEQGGFDRAMTGGQGNTKQMPIGGMAQKY